LGLWTLLADAFKDLLICLAAFLPSMHDARTVVGIAERICQRVRRIGALTGSATKAPTRALRSSKTMII